MSGPHWESGELSRSCVPSKWAFLCQSCPIYLSAPVWGDGLKAAHWMHTPHCTVYPHLLSPNYRSWTPSPLQWTCVNTSPCSHHFPVYLCRRHPHYCITQCAPLGSPQVPPAVPYRTISWDRQRMQKLEEGRGSLEILAAAAAEAIGETHS